MLSVGGPNKARVNVFKLGINSITEVVKKTDVYENKERKTTYMALIVHVDYYVRWRNNG